MQDPRIRRHASSIRAAAAFLCVPLVIAAGCGKSGSPPAKTRPHGIQFEKLLIGLPSSWSPFDPPPGSTDGGSSIRFRSGRSLIVIEVGVHAPKYSAEPWMGDFSATDAHLHSTDGTEYPVKLLTWRQDGSTKRDYEIGLVFEMQGVAYAITAVCANSEDRDRCAREILASIQVNGLER